jgi:hypothetical protein
MAADFTQFPIETATITERGLGQCKMLSTGADGATAADRATVR